MKTLLSSEELASAVVAYARMHDRIPMNAEVKKVTIHVDATMSEDLRVEIEWEPAKEAKR